MSANDDDNNDDNHEENDNGKENRKKKPDDIPRDFSQLHGAGVKDDNDNGGNENIIWSCPVCGNQFYSIQAYNAHTPCRG
jgi:hypothetical protein